MVSTLPAEAYPGALNLIPIPDVLGSREMRFAYESDGHKSPFGNREASYLYTEFGMGRNVEVGADLYDVSGANVTYLNAKYRINPESGVRPALAVGVMNVANGIDPSYYAISAKTVGRSHAYLGVQSQGGRTSAMLGSDYKLTEKTSLLFDWQTGSGYWSTAGIYWQAKPAVGVTLYFVRNNDRGLSDTDYLGLNVAYTFSEK